MKSSYQQKTAEIKRAWHLVDLDGQTLGRVATEIARFLTGKDKVTYTPHIDAGDYVVVINADKLVLTGNNMANTLYQHHTGFPGGFRVRTAKKQMELDPIKVVEHAVRGMVPKNKLNSPRMRRLKVYVGSTHPHENHFIKESK